MKGYLQLRTSKKLFHQTWQPLWFVLTGGGGGDEEDAESFVVISESEDDNNTVNTVNNDEVAGYEDRYLLAFAHEAQEDRRGANARLRHRVKDLASVRIRQSQQQHNIASYYYAATSSSTAAGLELEIRTAQNHRIHLRCADESVLDKWRSEILKAKHGIKGFEAHNDDPIDAEDISFRPRVPSVLSTVSAAPAVIVPPSPKPDVIDQDDENEDRLLKVVTPRRVESGTALAALTLSSRRRSVSMTSLAGNSNSNTPFHLPPVVRLPPPSPVRQESGYTAKYQQKAPSPYSATHHVARSRASSKNSNSGGTLTRRKKPALPISSVNLKGMLQESEPVLTSCNVYSTPSPSPAPSSRISDVSSIAIELAIDEAVTEKENIDKIQVVDEDNYEKPSSSDNDDYEAPSGDDDEEVGASRSSKVAFALDDEEGETVNTSGNQKQNVDDNKVPSLALPPRNPKPPNPNPMSPKSPSTPGGVRRRPNLFRMTSEIVTATLRRMSINKKRRREAGFCSEEQEKPKSNSAENRERPSLPMEENVYEDMDLEDEEEKKVIHRKAKKVEKRANAKSLPRRWAASFRRSFRSSSRQSSSAEDFQEEGEEETQPKPTRKKSKKAKKLPPKVEANEEDTTAAAAAALMTPPTSPLGFGVSKSPSGAPTMALMTAGMAMVSAGDGELQNKLKKWKQSADTSSPIFSDAQGNSTADSRKSYFTFDVRPPLPEKPARFRQRQLRKLLDGQLQPPEHKKWKGKSTEIRGMLDLVTMQLKVELRSKGGWEKERDTLSRELYDFPRSFQGGEVKLRRKK